MAKRKRAKPKTGPASRNQEIRTVRVADIVANPKNFRTHDDVQQGTLQAVVDKIGFYGYPDVFEHPEHPGKVMLIDGELRSKLLAEYGPDAEVEVNVTDFEPSEADVAIATHDPISAMAGVQGERLDSLLDDIGQMPGLDDLLGDLSKQAEDAIALTSPKEVTEDEVPEPPADPITQPGDLWLLGVYWECDTCGKTYSHDEGASMGGECPCE